VDRYQGKYRIASTRLKQWDYGANGCYFITMCVHDRVRAFGCVENRIMRLNPFGAIAERYWHEIPHHFPFVLLDAFVVMPDHVHGIIIIDRSIWAGLDHADIAGHDAIVVGHDAVVARHGAIDVETGHCPVSTSQNAHHRTRENNETNARHQTHVHNEPDTHRDTHMETKRKRGTISSIIGSYKSVCAKMIHRMPGGERFRWQSRFYDCIIRDEESLRAVRNYIANNPMRWG